MSTTKSDVRAGLNTLFQTLTNVGDLVVEGQIFTPSRDKPYLRSRVSGYSNMPLGIGPDATEQIDATYEIVVNRPGQEGITGAESIARKVCGVFARGTALPLPSGVTATIMSVTEVPGMASGDWIRAPVIVRIYATDP